MKKGKVTAVQLRVAEAKQRDVGKWRARIDEDTMESLGVGPGDVIELIGKGVTAAIAWPADEEDQFQGIVRIDGQTRKNAGVALNEYVTVKRSNARVAKALTLVPTQMKLSPDREFCEFVKNRLKGLPLCEGDEISVMVLGSPILFAVQKVRPKGVVKVEQSTKLYILPEATVEPKGRLRVTYDDVGGLKEQIRRLREIVEVPLRHPEIFQRLNIDPPKGVLLYGPPGCGKTLLARALANESEASFFSISGPEIMNKYYGESEARLREIFKEAKDNAPSIIFIDELDAIAPRREEVFGDVEKRVVAQLLALMDGMADRGDVIVIGATNRPDDLDPALRRPGRFDREIEIGVPNKEGRLEVLQIHTRGMPLASNVNLKALAEQLHGYTGADIKALCREAALKALRRFLPDIEREGDRIPPHVLEKMVVTAEDFKEAMKEIVPTALREFYVEPESIRWSDIGGLEDVKKRLEENVIWAIKEPERFTSMGIRPPKGVLLFGPPGCGKTMLARALAMESGANIISVKGPELLSKWVGESEKAIREVFRKARASSPCIIFFDEIDAIARARGGELEDAGVGDRILSQLLTELDDPRGEVVVVGATNRPDLLDNSLLRAGRFDLLLYVPPPDQRARLEILRIKASKMPMRGVSLEELAERTKGYSGADLESLCREAAIEALSKDGPRSSGRRVITEEDFRAALGRVKGSITPQVEEWYKSIKEKLTKKLLTPEERGLYA